MSCHRNADSPIGASDADSRGLARGQLASPDLQHAFGEAVAGRRSPKALVIGADNKAVGLDGDPCGKHWVDLEKAIEAGVAYAVRVSDCILALDADHTTSIRTVNKFVALLERDGLKPVVMASGGTTRGQRRLHVFVALDSPDEVHRRTTQLHELEADARPRVDVRHTIRPPFAPHRLQLPVELVSPSSADQALRSLTARRGTQEAPRERQTLDWNDLLASGRFPPDYRGEDRSGSAVTFVICIGAIRNGFSFDAVRSMLSDEANAGGDSYRRRVTKRGRKAADRWLKDYVWPGAEEAASRVAVTDDATARSEITAFREAVGSQSWPGAGGASTQRILLALCEIALEQGSIHPIASHRRIAERAGVTSRTVRRKVKQGALEPWARVEEPGGFATEVVRGEVREKLVATRWRLRRPSTERARTVPSGGTPPPVPGVMGTPRASLPLNHDAFRHGALGGNARRVLELLVAGPQLTAAQIGEKLGLNVGHLRYRLLPKLEAAGLVQEVGDQAWSPVECLQTALDQAAEDSGFAGHGARQAEEHVRQREQYRDFLAETRAKRIRDGIPADSKVITARSRPRRRAGQRPPPYRGRSR